MDTLQRETAWWCPACRQMTERDHYGTIEEMAPAGKINSSCVSRLLRLTLLAPEIVKAILDWRQPEGITLPAVMGGVEREWPDQRRVNAKEILNSHK